MTKRYERHRRRGMENRYKYDDDYLEKYDVDFPLGAGKTKDSTFEVKQFPFPTDQSVRDRKTIDIRKVPRLGID